MTSTFMIILLQWSNLLESKLAKNMETFNEVITLLTLYLLMCFCDFVGDAETRAECGKGFIAVLIFYASVHMYLLFGDVFGKIRHKIRKKYYDRIRLKHAANLKEKEKEKNLLSHINVEGRTQ